MKEIRQIKTIYGDNGLIEIGEIMDEDSVQFKIYESRKDYEICFSMDLDSLWDFNTRITKFLSNRGYRV